VDLNGTASPYTVLLTNAENTCGIVTSTSGLTVSGVVFSDERDEGAGFQLSVYGRYNGQALAAGMTVRAAAPNQPVPGAPTPAPQEDDDDDKEKSHKTVIIIVVIVAVVVVIGLIGFAATRSRGGSGSGGSRSVNEDHMDAAYQAMNADGTRGEKVADSV